MPQWPIRAEQFVQSSNLIGTRNWILCLQPHRISVRSVTINRRTSRDAACTMIIGKDAPLGPSCVKVTSDPASWWPWLMHFISRRPASPPPLRWSPGCRVTLISSTRSVQRYYPHHPRSLSQNTTNTIDNLDHSKINKNKCCGILYALGWAFLFPHFPDKTLFRSLLMAWRCGQWSPGCTDTRLQVWTLWIVNGK